MIFLENDLETWSLAQWFFRRITVLTVTGPNVKLDTSISSKNGVDNVGSADQRQRYSVMRNWDFSDIQKYIAKNLNLSPGEVAELIEEYRRYIAMHIFNPATSKPMCPKIDEVWHTHILFTRNYIDFCNIVLGGYLHHKPSITHEERDRLIVNYRDNTLVEYDTLFGTPNPNIWPADHCVCRCCERD